MKHFAVGLRLPGQIGCFQCVFVVESTGLGVNLVYYYVRTNFSVAEWPSAGL